MLVVRVMVLVIGIGVGDHIGDAGHFTSIDIALMVFGNRS